MASAKDEKQRRSKKIGFVESQAEDGESARKSGDKTYRKSTYPRESMAAMARKSSVLMLSRLMGPATASSRGNRSLHNRTSMYVAPRFQNSYRMDSTRPFHRETMQSMMNHFLQSYLGDYQYVAKKSKRLAENLSEELKNQFKLCQFDRYRFVAVVTVGEKKSQDFRCVSRALWDAEKDDFLRFTYEASTYFVIASVWAVYFE